MSLIGFLYKYVARPVLFLFNPEFVHNLMTRTGKYFGSTVQGRKLVQRILVEGELPRDEVTIQGIKFKNKVGLAAGFDYNADLTQIVPSIGFGFASVGTVTLESYPGNTKPRLTRLPHSTSILVNKGLKNVGVHSIIAKLEPFDFEIPIGISVASTNKVFDTVKEQIDNIVECFRVLEASKVKHSYYELNISCPNTHGSEGVFYEPANLVKLLDKLKPKKLSRPLFAKLPLHLPKKQLFEVVEVLVQHGVSTLIMGNLQKNRTTLNPQEQAKIVGMRGNLSGKPTHRQAVENTKMIKKNLGDKVTVIGLGGVLSFKDAEEFIEAGASAVQLITGMIYIGPQFVSEVAKDLAKL